jgi:hypothetical protein
MQRKQRKKCINLTKEKYATYVNPKEEGTK